MPNSPNCPAVGVARHPVAEIVLAAGIEPHVGRKHTAVSVEKADQAAIVVDVPMADDQRLDLARVDLQQAHIVDDRRRGIAEVQQDRALLLVALRFEVERETPFIVQHIARVGAAARPGRLVNHAVDGAAAQELVVLLVDQHTHGQLVDGRHLDRRRAGELDAAEARGCRAGKGGGGFEEIATVE